MISKLKPTSLARLGLKQPGGTDHSQSNSVEISESLTQHQATQTRSQPSLEAPIKKTKTGVHQAETSEESVLSEGLKALVVTLMRKNLTKIAS